MSWYLWVLAGIAVYFLLAVLVGKVLKRTSSRYFECGCGWSGREAAFEEHRVVCEVTT